MEFEDLIRLIETVSKSGLTGFKYENGGMKLQMSKKTCIRNNILKRWSIW